MPGGKTVFVLRNKITGNYAHHTNGSLAVYGTEDVAKRRQYDWQCRIVRGVIQIVEVEVRNDFRIRQRK